MGKITINMDSLKSRQDWHRHKIQDGENIFRILPPFGNPETHNNYPYRRWVVAWLVDPKTNKRRPFGSPRTQGEPCPVHEYSEKLTKFINDKKSQLEAAGNTESDVRAELEGLRKVQWEIRTQGSYLYNASDRSGTVGLLELKAEAHKGIKKMMNQYIKEYAQDPTSLNCEDDDSGVWFRITKSGKSKDTEYDVAFNQLVEKVNGKVIKTDDRSTLSENIVSNYSELGFDLSAVYQPKNYQDLHDILVYTLSFYNEEIPEAILPGYEFAGAVKTTATTTAAKPVTTKPSSSKISIKIDREDENNDEESAFVAPVLKQQVAVKTTAAPAASKQAPKKASFTPVEDDEAFALANEILGN